MNDFILHLEFIDITYIRLKEGFCYLTAIIDWRSRRILSWRLSNTLSTAFCVECAKEAFGRFGRPEIFNTDQGSQYTSRDFTELFEEKDEDIYIKGYENMRDCRDGVAAFVDRYNDRRDHSSLDAPPSDVYFKRVTLNNDVMEKSGHLIF